MIFLCFGKSKKKKEKEVKEMGITKEKTNDTAPETKKLAKDEAEFTLDVMVHEVDVEDTDEELDRLEKCGLHSYHIARVADGDDSHKWRVRRSCTDSTIKYFRTQKEAIDFAKTLAKENELPITIHKVDGKIRKQKYV